MVEMPGPSPSSGKAMGGQQLSSGEVPPIPPPGLGEPALAAEAAPAAGGSGGGWFGGWFGGKKEEAEAPASAAPKDLSHDPFAPPAMPDFGGAGPQFR